MTLQGVRKLVGNEVLTSRATWIVRTLGKYNVVGRRVRQRAYRRSRPGRKRIIMHTDVGKVMPQARFERPTGSDWQWDSGLPERLFDDGRGVTGRGSATAMGPRTRSAESSRSD